MSEAGAKVRSRDVPARHGWLWIRDGFRLFVRAPLMCWVAIALWCLLYLLLRGVLSVVGELLFAAIYPALSAGFMLGCQAIERGEELEFAHIVAGFRQPRAQLLKLGAITLAVGLLLGSLALFIAPPDQEALKQLEHPGPEMQQDLLRLMPFVTAQLLASLPILLGNWFAAALIVFHSMPVTHAIRWSVYACIGNLGAFTVYGLASFLLMFVALLPFGLGLVVLLPTLLATTYTSYRDVFASVEPDAPVTTA